MAAAVKEANARADAVVEEAAAKVVEVGATPFTRCAHVSYELPPATRIMSPPLSTNRLVHVIVPLRDNLSFGLLAKLQSNPRPC